MQGFNLVIDMEKVEKVVVVKKKKNQVKPDLKRTNKRYISFNDKEMSAIDCFCKKYKVSNRSKFMREAIISAILKKFDEDYPTLFEVDPPTLFTNSPNPNYRVKNTNTRVNETQLV